MTLSRDIMDLICPLFFLDISVVWCGFITVFFRVAYRANATLMSAGTTSCKIKNKWKCPKWQCRRTHRRSPFTSILELYSSYSRDAVLTLDIENLYALGRLKGSRGGIYCDGNYCDAECKKISARSFDQAHHSGSKESCTLSWSYTPNASIFSVVI
jgi:hypothetical protein